ncbi:MAG: DUF4271 domain-containing protein [Petrimonas sp.]|uniref:DUF4271 domain-containing protein n=1 Tax=Petrimonas sp. TaxID=2023866 RepID=UPI002B3E9580|nr:DUF4271 domain-containing protein [Petrimonas sp.]MEA5046316.1 DUF4271 domain-containing protein [Petrimonas sp.]
MPDRIPQIQVDNVIGQSSDSIRVGFLSFEYIPTDNTGLFFNVDSSTFSISSGQIPEGFSGVLLPFSQTVQSVFFLFFAFCFVIVAFWFNREGPTLAANYRNIFSGGVRRRTIFKEEITTAGIWSEFFLIFQTILILTIVFFTFFWDKGISDLSVKNKVLVFLAAFLGILLFLSIKYLVYKLIGYVFTEWGMGEWTEKYFRVVELMGVFVFIPAMFFVFVPEYAKIALFLLIIIFFIIMMVVFWNLLNVFAKNKVGLLNYFLYLCAIEIVPFFLVYKGVVSLVNIAGN